MHDAWHPASFSRTAHPVRCGQVYDIPEVDVMGGTYYQSDPVPALMQTLSVVNGRKAVVVKEFGVVGDASFYSAVAVMDQVRHRSCFLVIVICSLIIMILFSSSHSCSKLAKYVSAII